MQLNITLFFLSRLFRANFLSNAPVNITIKSIIVIQQTIPVKNKKERKKERVFALIYVLLRATFLSNPFSCVGVRACKYAS